MVILAAAAVVALLVWGYLLVGHGGFWRTDPRLPVAGADPPRWPTVVAVVPARDEAVILPQTLPTLLAQDYLGEFRVVVVDDGSRDGTAQVAESLGNASRANASWGDVPEGEGCAAVPDPGTGVPRRAAGRDLRVVRAAPPPEGWAGKVWAMSEGVRAAGDAEYLLFTDADIAYRPGTLTRLVRAAEGDRRDLVSQMALLRAQTGWERVVVPAFVYFFAQLYPFRRVNRPGGRTAAAAGGCMLVRREALAAAGGLAPIRGALIDDVALGRLLKSRAGARCWLGFTTDVVSRRPYPRLADLWGMVARSAYTQLRYSPVLLLGTIAGLLLVYAVPPLAAVAGLVGLARGGGPVAGAAAAAGLLAWLVMAATYLPVLRLYGLAALRAPTLPLIALLYAAMTVDSARRHLLGRGGAWKGRTMGHAGEFGGRGGQGGRGRPGRPGREGEPGDGRTAGRQGAV